MEWPLIKLDRVVQIRTGTTTPAQFPEETFELYSIPGFDAGKPELLSGSKIKSNKTNILPGDVLFSKLNPRIPRVWIVPPKTEFRQVSSTEFWPLVRDQGLLDPQYLRYYLQTPRLRERLSPSTEAATKSRSRIKPFQLLAELIPLPPLSEQRRIVDILDQADSLRRLRSDADAKAASILPALFIKMFGDPATNPMGWPEKNLGSQATIVTGNTPSTKNPEYYGSTLPWARPADLDRAPLVEYSERALSRSGRMVARVVPAKSVLVVCIGATLGKVGMAGAEMAINQQINAVLPSPNLLSEFLFVQCALSASRFRAAATKSTLPILNKSKFAAQHVLVPPVETQEKFAQAAQSAVSVWRGRSMSDKHLEFLFRIFIERAFTGGLTASRRETHK